MLTVVVLAVTLEFLLVPLLGDPLWVVGHIAMAAGAVTGLATSARRRPFDNHLSIRCTQPANHVHYARKIAA